MSNAKKEKGMALMETLIAMLIFAIALVPLVKLQVNSMEATRSGRYKTEVAAAAESLMDYLRSDRKEIFNGKWDNIIVWSGIPCDEKSENQKIACEILNPPNRNTYADENAVLCVTGAPDAANDQYVINIRALWYSGKIQKGEEPLVVQDPDHPKDHKKRKLGKEVETFCSSGRTSSLLQQDNIDSIDIKMVY